MHSVRSFLLASLLVVVLAGASGAAELRGAWVTAWTKGFFTREEADATVAAARCANLNALFIQVRKNADAYYTSALEPRGSGLAPGFDPLEYIIEKAHAQGIEVHAWINTFRVWTSKTDPTDPSHLVRLHPDWLNKEYSGKARASEGLYLDPGVPEARSHVVNVIADIATRYKIDGIHLDYIRYPGREWGYSEKALGRYYAETGASARPQPKDPKWLEWRRQQVTTLVRAARDRLTGIRPGIRFSASTIPWGGCSADFCSTSPYSDVCQDWRAWMQGGLLDANVPMNYKVEKNPKSAQQFRDWLEGFRKWGGGKPVYVGIDVGSNDVAGTLKQIEAVRKSRHEGFVLFSFNQSAKREALVKALSGGPCSASAASPRRG